METSTDCRPTCPCKARTAGEAVNRAAEMIGMDVRFVASLMAILRANGWTVTRVDGDR